MLHSAVDKSNAVIKPNIQGNNRVWICCMCEARICLSSDIAQRPQNPKKNKVTFSQGQMVCFHMLFWQPFPVVVILPNSLKWLFNGGPSPISRAGAAAFTSLHVDLCFLCFRPDRKPSILPLVDLDCTSEGGIKRDVGDREQPCPVPRLWLGCEEFQRKPTAAMRLWMSSLTWERQCMPVGKRLRPSQNKLWPVLYQTPNGKSPVFLVRVLKIELYGAGQKQHVEALI